MTSLPSNRLKVFCRLRNPPPSDMRSPDLFKLNPFTNSIELENRTLYSFNKILSNTSQQEIFDSIMSPIIRDAFLYRKSGLIFSYGITNSGKTYTIIGNEENKGILPRTLERLVDIKNLLLFGRQFPAEYDMKAEDIKHQTSNSESFALEDIRYEFECFEIYNEEIMDLSQDLIKDKMGQILPRIKLQIKENNRKTLIKDLKQHEITDHTSFEPLLSRILKNRSQNETLLNTVSSRSHCLFRINIYFQYKSSTNLLEFNVPLLIVDLAGSERAKRIDNYGQSPLMTEACNINKSLLVLGRCLKSLSISNNNNNTNNKNNDISPLKGPVMIPYRDSKLTRILFEYFNENSNLNMIVNINTNPQDYDETIRVLDYANLAKQIQPTKSVLGLKTPLVSEKKGLLMKEESNFFLNEKLVEQQKKIEMLEGIVSSLNDQLLVNNIMAKYNTIVEMFEKENDRIFQLEQEDLRRFGSYDDIYTIKVIQRGAFSTANSEKSEKQSGNSIKTTNSMPNLGEEPKFDEKKNDLKEISPFEKEIPSFQLSEIQEDSSHNEEAISFQEKSFHNHKNDQKKSLIKLKEFKEIGLNTSPGLFVRPFLEKATSPFLPSNFLQENPQNSQKKHKNVYENLSTIVLQELPLDSPSQFFSNGNTNNENSKNNNDGSENNKNDNEEQKNQSKNNENDKENDYLAANGQKKQKKQRKAKKKEKEECFSQEESLSRLDQDLEQYNYSKIQKDYGRVTPMIKRLRVRPNAKKHQCF